MRSRKKSNLCNGETAKNKQKSSNSLKSKDNFQLSNHFIEKYKIKDEDKLKVEIVRIIDKFNILQKLEKDFLTNKEIIILLNSIKTKSKSYYKKLNRYINSFELIEKKNSQLGKETKEFLEITKIINSTIFNLLVRAENNSNLIKIGFHFRLRLLIAILKKLKSLTVLSGKIGKPTNVKKTLYLINKISNPVYELSERASVALDTKRKQKKSKAGRKEKFYLKQFIKKFLCIYEEITGKKPTLTNNNYRDENTNPLPYKGKLIDFCIDIRNEIYPTCKDKDFISFSHTLFHNIYPKN